MKYDKDMANKTTTTSWIDLVAVTTAIIAVLATIASFQVGADTSVMLLEKNNATLYQNQANKEWNTYLAQEITSLHEDTSLKNLETQKQAQEELQQNTALLEKKVTTATDKAQVYFEKTSKLSIAGIFLQGAIALSAMSVLLKKKYLWIFSLLIAGVGVYFFLFIS